MRARSLSGRAPTAVFVERSLGQGQAGAGALGRGSAGMREHVETRRLKDRGL